MGYAGVVLLSFPSLQLTNEYSTKGLLKFPYIPGLLSFREAPLLLKLLSKIQTTPDLIFFDGLEGAGLIRDDLDLRATWGFY